MSNFTGYGFYAVIMLVASSLFIASCSMMGMNGGSGEMSNKMDIVNTAVSTDSFNTLTTALTEAGLVDTLQGPGPFTVFAPTDEAFSKLPSGTVEDLLKAENKDKLVSILTYHVVTGKVMAEQVVTLNTVETVNGKELNIKVKDGKVMVDNATVTETDITASNGVIHVIDEVLIP